MASFGQLRAACSTACQCSGGTGPLRGRSTSSSPSSKISGAASAHSPLLSHRSKSTTTCMGRTSHLSDRGSAAAGGFPRLGSLPMLRYRSHARISGIAAWPPTGFSGFLNNCLLFLYVADFARE
jgi:hypothetical protein